MSNKDNTVTLEATRKDCNLCKAQITLGRTWRPLMTGSRQWGFKIVDQGFGHDFGDVDFFHHLPVGTAAGVPSDLTWRKQAA